MQPSVIVVRERERVGRVMNILQSTNHHGYPVVDDYDPDMTELLDLVLYCNPYHNDIFC